MFFVRSAETAKCPCCSNLLDVIGCRPRSWYMSSGERAKLIIRRLRCKGCKRIHHELPDILVPYKRYDAESIEGVVSDPPREDVAADEVTLYRWKAWFAAWAVYAGGVLQSIAVRFPQAVENSSAPPRCSALHRLGHYVGNTAGWLSRTVRPIVNLNEW